GNETADWEGITGEVGSCERVVVLRVWHCTVGPEMRRDIGLGVVTVGIKPFDETFEPPDDEAARFLNQPCMPDRERTCDSPGDDGNGHRRDESSEACAPIVVHAGEHLVHIAPQSGDKNHRYVDEEKEHEIQHHQEMNR